MEEWFETLMSGHKNYKDADHCQTELKKISRLNTCVCKTNDNAKTTSTTIGTTSSSDPSAVSNSSSDAYMLPLIDKPITSVCATKDYNPKLAASYGILLSCTNKEGICSLSSINSDSKCYDHYQYYKKHSDTSSDKKDGFFEKLDKMF